MKSLHLINSFLNSRFDQFETDNQIDTNHLTWTRNWNNGTFTKLTAWKRVPGIWRTNLPSGGLLRWLIGFFPSVYYGQRISWTYFPKRSCFGKSRAPEQVNNCSMRYVVAGCPAITDYVAGSSCRVRCKPATPSCLALRFSGWRAGLSGFRTGSRGHDAEYFIIFTSTTKIRSAKSIFWRPWPPNCIYKKI